MHANFVHLRTHSSYSLAEGAIKVEELADLCLKNRMPAVAIADNGNLFCSLEFSKACSQSGIQPIIGSLLNIDPQLDKDTGYNNSSKQELDKILLLAKDKAGYKNLLKLVSHSFISCEDNLLPHIKLSDLEELNQGLIALTCGPDGTIGKLLLADHNAMAEKFLLKLKSIFADRLYIELMRHNLEPELLTEERFIDLAYKHDIALVATNDIYFASKDMFEAHEILLSIADGTHISDSNRRKLTPEHYFKSAAEMNKLFADLPEAIENTLIITQRCSVKSEESPPMLPSFSSEQGLNEDEEFKHSARTGLEDRLLNEVLNDNMTDTQKAELRQLYSDRLGYELDIIIRMKFPGYFLIVSDFIKWSKKNDIPVGPGRGSGAGSLVAWCLDITDLDPIRFGLLFERFLNPERVSMPDFDIDFCQERRDEVINYVREKYGKERVAQIITFGKLQARAVIRDVGRVLGLPYGQMDRIAKLVPFNAINPVTLSQAIEMEPALKKEQEEDPAVSKLLSIALKLEGLHRHASIHAAGLVISGSKLEEIVPLYRDQESDMLVVQYSMKYAEAAGLVKFDFLGLKTLTVIAKTCELIKQSGSELYINKIPLDDSKTYTMLSNGLSVGVFQFEGAGMRDALRKLKPDSINDLVALGALYRPGPMENIPTYIARKHGLEAPDYMHPNLGSVLSETFGVIIYQEQVMQIAQILAGYTPGAADLLRRAMGKKIKAEMDAQRQLFIDGAIKNKVPHEQASNIFDLVAKFAGYGFNKSHAAAYGLISYQTAYLKANFPIEFITASCNLEIADTDKISIYKEEAHSLGLTLLPPDINKSATYFSIETLADSSKAIRYGIGAIKGISINAMEGIIAEREKNGQFADVFDFCSRIDSKLLNKRQLEGLIKSGALDELNKNRRQLTEAIEILLQYSANRTKERASSQKSFFDNLASAQNTSLPQLPEVLEWDSEERLQNECEVIGFYLSAHPLDNLKPYLKHHDIVNASYLANDLAEGYSLIKIAGVVSTTKTRVSPRGRFVSVQLSDSSGIFEVSIFNDEILAKSRDLLASKTPLLITAEARKDEGGVRLTAQSIQKLDAFLEHKYSLLQIWVNGQEALTTIKSLCAANSEQGIKVHVLVVTEHNEEIQLELPAKYPISPANSLYMESLPGILKVKLV